MLRGLSSGESAFFSEVSILRAERRRKNLIVRQPGLHEAVPVERDTRQRRAIERVLREAGRPLTREEILVGARVYARGLGAATVNRAIRDLAANGHLLGVDFPGQPIRYELPGQDEHPHFICRVCNRVFDWEIETPAVPVTVPDHFDVWGCEVLFYGRCPGCRAAAQTKKGA